MHVLSILISYSNITAHHVLHVNFAPPIPTPCLAPPPHNHIPLHLSPCTGQTRQATRRNQHPSRSVPPKADRA